MTKSCDHKSVGMIVRRRNKVLLIERRQYPFGFAFPAGHVDSDKTFEEAARRELMEEVGLKVTRMKLVFEGRKDNKCRRPGGNWHYWKIYDVDAEGRVKRSKEETKKAGWYTKTEIGQLAERTKEYLEGKISEQAWLENPGLEEGFSQFQLGKELNI